MPPTCEIHKDTNLQRKEWGGCTFYECPKCEQERIERRDRLFVERQAQRAEER
jgi:hypothetical protein